MPIGGTGYRVESPTAREGLRLRLLLLDGDATLGNDAEVAELRKLMGDTLEQMAADGISWPEIVHAGRTALLHYAVSADVAAKHWALGADDPGNPIPPAPPTAPGAAPISHYRERTGPPTPAAGSSCPSSG